MPAKAPAEGVTGVFRYDGDKETFVPLDEAAAEETEEETEE